jgi:hypothetical protein
MTANGSNYDASPIVGVPDDDVDMAEILSRRNPWTRSVADGMKSISRNQSVITHESRSAPAESGETALLS